MDSVVTFERSGREFSVNAALAFALAYRCAYAGVLYRLYNMNIDEYTENK